MMTVADVERIMQEWAPSWAAMEKDNVGLQLGQRKQRVSKIMIALEITDTIVAEAIKKKIDLVLTHHPPFFHPAASITDSDQAGKNILALARTQIAIYAAHTNLDFTRHGVSFVLADMLGLDNVRFLSPLKGTLSKIVVFVPSSHVEQVAQEMSNAGAGIIGNYDSCSFRVEGTGTFHGGDDSHPSLGKRGTFERVNEVRLEMVVPSAGMSSVVKALKQSHPYEEVAFDIYPTETPNANFGMGAIGTLDRELTLQSFLRKCKQALSAQSLRFTGDRRAKVKTVAVCGGSGSDLLEAAIHGEADIFVTADVRYHTFHSARGRIALVDAGHWETEHGILNPMRARLRNAAERMNQKVSIIVAQTSTNPVQSI